MKNSPLIYSDPSGMAPETVYEIVEEDGLTYQYMYELVRDGEIECMNPQYKKFISKHLVGGGSGKGYDPTKDIYNKYNEYKEGSQGRDISVRGGGWKGTGDNSGGSGARQGSLEDWLTNQKKVVRTLSNDQSANILSQAYKAGFGETPLDFLDDGNTLTGIGLALRTYDFENRIRQIQNGVKLQKTLPNGQVINVKSSMLTKSLQNIKKVVRLSFVLGLGLNIIKLIQASQNNESKMINKAGLDIAMTVVGIIAPPIGFIYFGVDIFFGWENIPGNYLSSHSPFYESSIPTDKTSVNINTYFQVKEFMRRIK